MRKFAPYLANGCPTTCWHCGKPFTVRGGNAEAIVGDDNQLYCHREECQDTALLSHVHTLGRTSVIERLAA